MGFITFTHPRIMTSLGQTTHHKGAQIETSSRDPSASVATGNKKQHMQEEQMVLSKALFGRAEKAKDVVNGIPIW